MIRYLRIPSVIPLLIPVLLSGLGLWLNQTLTTDPIQTLDRSKKAPRVAQTQIPWVKNASQWSDEVAFVAHTFSGNVMVNRSGEIVYVLPIDSISGYVLKERFVDLDITIGEVPLGKELVPSTTNYFIGNDSCKWITNVPAYRTLRLGDIWEGISVELRAYNHNVEKLFYVSPHTDPKMIQMDLEGAESLSVSNDGQLIVHTSSGELAYSAPIAYQWIEGKKHGVEVAYQIDKDLKTRYTFQVSNYNPAHELIIDPFLASTFIGAGRNDWSNAITIGPDEHVFITGYTWTDTFPTLVGSYDEAFSGVKDAYVAKLSNDLSTLVASTFLGGASWEGGLSIWAEDSGNIIVSGATGSADFPTTSNAYDNTYNGGTNDVFVCKLNNNLSQLLVSTFIGGDDDDYGYDLTQDQAGNIFLCGVTESANFPSFHGFDQSFNGGFEDVFVCKLNNGLTNLLASTYLGGSTDESADAVIADQAGNIFISGFTYSPDFPIAGVVYDSTHNGSGDIFISKLGNNLDTLIASTFIGGANFEESHAIALDSLQNIFIAGYTGSFEYPSTPGVFDPSFNNNHDAIITKIDNNLTNILASTFIGGTGADDAYGLVVQGTQNVFITGITFSNDYPTTTNASDDTYNGRRDIFLSRLSFDLSELKESTYIGGSDNDWALDLGIDSEGSAFIGGGTFSDNFPMVGSPYDGSFNGGEDIIIAKIAGCGVNDFCDSDVMFGSIFLDVDRNPYCLEGCSATAGSGPQRDGGCFDFPQATVWYTFTPAASRPCIKISVTSEVLIQPQMAVFQDACPGSSSSIPFTCAVGSAGMLDIQMGVEAGVTYYIAVSDATGAEGYFDICLVHSPEDALALTVDARDVQCFERGNGEINLTVTNGTGIIDYDWNQDWLDGMMHVNTLSIGTYSVTVTDENNCVAESDSVVISQPDQLFVDLVLEDIMANNTIIYGDTILAWADASIGNEAISRISWLPANVLTSTLTDAVIDQYISPLQATELIVILEDTMGCSVSDSTYILVSDDFPFYVPNAFAPLSTQAKNAIFRPFFSNKVQAIHSMRVFNRWGNVVYERFDFPVWDESEGWDGRMYGQLLDSGVYVFVLEVEFINGDVRMYSGDVTLVR